MSRSSRSVVGQVLVLASVSAVAAAAWQHARVPNLDRVLDRLAAIGGAEEGASAEVAAPPAAPTPPFPTIDLAGAKRRVDDGSGLFVDARAPQQFNAGHIPGAINLPLDDVDRVFPSVADRLRQAPEVIVYCGRNACSLSTKVALLLRRRGLTNVALFPDGWDAWMAAGYPTASP